MGKKDAWKDGNANNVLSKICSEDATAVGHDIYKYIQCKVWVI